MIKNKGFTLIELLVVIGIIGILSSVVLASLNVARDKAADAKTKSQLASARDAAEIFFNKNGGYNGAAGDVAWDCTTVDSMFQDTDSGMNQYTDPNNYPSPATISIRCSSTDSAFSISASMVTPGEFWCVDSTGISKQVLAADHLTAHPDSDTACH